MRNLLRHWRIWVCLVGIFAAGVGTGAVITWKAAKAIGPAGLQNYAPAMKVVLRRRVDILPEQEAELNRILDTAQQRLNETRDHTRTEILSILDEAHEEIRGHLEDDQRERFDAFLQRHDPRMK